MDTCVVDKQPLGVTQCNKLPAMPKTIVTTSSTFKFTPEQYATEAAMKTALEAAITAGQAQRVHIWPNFVTFENISEEPKYEETPLAYLPVRDGNYRFRFGIKQSLCLHKAMFSHRAASGRAFVIDTENQWIGTMDSDGNFMGLSIQMLHTEKLMFSDGNVSSKSPIVLALADNTELDANGAIIKGAFITTVSRLTQVSLEIISAAAAEIVVKAFITCDGTPLNGLAKEDFILLDEDGDPQTINARTEADGTYTLTKSSGSWVNGTLGLETPANLTVKAYELDEAVDVVIGS